jgi:hypothetical protein
MEDLSTKPSHHKATHETGGADALTALSAAVLTSGTVATARLGSGSASSSTFLRGDQTWATPAGSTGTVTVFYQDSTPTANAVDDLWYETDTNHWWFWNGTYWLSTALYHNMPFQVANLNSAGTSGYCVIEPDSGVQYDIYIVDLVASTFVLTTNDGTRYYAFKVQGVIGNGTASDIGSGFNTSADSANAWVPHKVAINTFVDVSSTAYKVFYVNMARNGATPGNLYAQAGITYRLVHL